MKLAFSTLGCPDWTLDQVIETARTLGYDGVEFRGLGPAVDLTDVPAFAPGRITRTREALAAAGVAVACLSSSTTIISAMRDDVDRQHAETHVRHYIDMAREVDAPFVRVFCGAAPEGMPRAVALDRATASLRHLGDYAVPRGVTLVLETHDDCTRSARLMELVRPVAHPAVQALWDIHHPYRAAAEPVDDTVRALGAHLRYTHIKDSVLHDDGESFTYVKLGHGDVPLLPAIRALVAMGYDGYLTYEWEKRWHPALDAPDIALPHAVAQLRTWLAEA